MKKLFRKLIEPYTVFVLFLLFVISLIVFFETFDYRYKKLKALVTLFYILPGLIFFITSSVYNVIINKNKTLLNKLIILTPLVIIIIYFIYLMVLLIIS